MQGSPFAPDTATGAAPDAQPRRFSPTSWEARLLASSLRSAPVTLLHGATAAERTALLRDGVLPLLGRRARDGMAPARPAPAHPAPDRWDWVLNAGRATDNRPELVLCITEWQSAPSPPVMPLRQRIAQAWTAAHAGRAQPANMQVLLLLDGLDGLLQGNPEQAGAFAREWVGTLASDPDNLHALIATGDLALPALQALGRHWPGFGEHALKLGAADAGVPPKLSAVHDATALPDAAALRSEQPPEPPPESAPASTHAADAQPMPAEARLSGAEWLASLHEAVERVAEQGRLHGNAVPTAVPSPPEAAAVVDAQARQARIGRRAVPFIGLGLTAVAATAALVLWPRLFTQATPPQAIVTAAAPATTTRAVATVTAIAPSPAPAPAPVPALAPAPITPTPPPMPAAAITPAAAAPATLSPMPRRPAVEAGLALRQTIAPLPLQDLRQQPGRLPALAGQSGGAALALVRYDALQARLDDPRLGSLRVVAPLFLEPVQVWVNARSPLRYLHQLRGRTVQLPRRAAGDALTAATLMRQAFGATTKIGPFANESDAMAALREGKSKGNAKAKGKGKDQVDAVLHVGLASAPERPGLRRLALDRQHPGTAAAMRQYLPAKAEDGTPALGVMSFLVSLGGDALQVDKLAGAAMERLCAELPLLRASDPAAWASVRPDSALPAGHPYAPAAQRAAAGCSAAKPPQAQTRQTHQGALR